ncbi:IS3 family transposase [Bacillus toyonensis]|uniref:IS3 family transposase n=1 Tax=Bacillus toyonensis TaxID=155322 RepID=A0A2C4R8J3_9BACI|nr:IS3 family transposase [Bacillus toyonensis]PGA94395.1 IS3 family transposase [Bacillus toyonensis]PHD73071.1 IS3 family transposase [Bacillus toyonensis]
MTKFTAEEKIAAVHSYLEGVAGYDAISASIGASVSTIRTWVIQYKHNGVEAFIKSYASYSAQFKLDVLNYMNEQGTSSDEAAAIFNIPSSGLIRKWRIQFASQGTGALMSKKEGRLNMMKETKKSVTSVKGSIEELQIEVERLRMENVYFKKVECLSSKQGSITKKEKVKVIFELRAEFPIRTLLKFACIPRSTYYYWVKKWNAPDKDAELKTLIQTIYTEHKGRYGYRRIRDELMNRGYQINHKKVQRIMKELGLACLVRMKKYRSYKGNVGKVASNILARNFQAKKPNEKWVTDITEFKVLGEKLYMSPLLDLFNGEIITYTISSKPTYSLVSNMLSQALERLTEADRPLLHSDQGWHYQMEKYRCALTKRSITQSMSRKGNCYDNAVIENFFGIMKSEFFYLQEFESVEHFKQELVKYIEYYNHKRIKAKLKGMSPVQYRTHTQEVA